MNFVSGYNLSASGVASFNNVALTPQSLTGAGTTATTNVEPSITDSATILGIGALASTTATTPTYGSDAITAAADSVTIASDDLSGMTTTTTYSAPSTKTASTRSTAGRGSPPL